METPCTGICKIDQETRQCQGCLRTIDEIASWATLTPAKRSHIMHALQKRKRLNSKQSQMEE